MPIPLDDGPGAGAPGLKLRNKGDHAVIRVCYQEIRPLLEFATKKPKLKDDGTPRKELVITGLFVSGTGVITRGGPDAREDLSPPVGSEVRLYLNGGRWSSWIDAKRAAGQINVGDVVKVKYDHDEPTKGFPAKVWIVTARPAKPEEAGAVAQAEAVYHRIKRGGQSSAATLLDDDASGDYAPRTAEPVNRPAIDDSEIPF